MAAPPDALSAAQSICVLRAQDFPVVSGANEGDALSFADDCILDDIFALKTYAEEVRLSLVRRASGQHIIAPGTQTGIPGAQVHLDCALSLMAADGPVIEVLVLVELDDDNRAHQVYVLPLTRLTPKTEYRLVGVDKAAVLRKFAQVGSVSFTRGTHITLGSGRQTRIEELDPGDSVLTRDEGVQKIRWIGMTTQRAEGAFAPICIARGTLNNKNDLIVSPDHRLFVYQRDDRLGAGRAELMVKARHLVNGTSVTVRKGGFVDYFQLVFDSHQIIYAEGIAAESMLVDDRTAPLLDPAVLKKITARPPHHRELSGLDVQKALLDRPDAVDLLRRASKG